MGKSPSQKALRVRELEADALVKAKRIDVLGSVLNNLIRYGCWFGCIFVLGKAIESLAGKTTFANIALAVLGNLTVERTLAIGLGAGGIGYGMIERRLRQRKTEYFQTRIRELEKERDAGRTSSKITPRGTTRPEDET